jgi:eukaryotic-like serine/threonine-protein kinase
MAGRQHLASHDSNFLPAGYVISHYEIRRPLGEGGMGVVYTALDQRLGREVALKFLNRQSLQHAKGKERFFAEARAAAVLDHPNICPVYGIEEAEGRTFIVMAFVRGRSLREMLNHGPLGLSESLNIGLQTAHGLEAAHQKGIVHRDIKPENLIVSDQGIVRIVDFGVAQLPEQTRLTVMGGAVGTLAYMSPEQAKGEKVNHQTDLWSLGVVLYEMVAGVPPFQGVNELALLNSILHKTPDSLTADLSDFSKGWQQVVARALERECSRRYQSASEMISDLEALASRTGSNVRHGSARYATGSTATGLAESTPAAASIAVLPLVNMSPDPDTEYFSDGLTEELISSLSACESLRVVARTSVFEFKGKTENVRTIGEKLRVNTVLEGSVRKANRKLRITVRLINVEDGYPLWSDKFDREMADIFAIQDEIAGAVAANLKVTLAEKRRRPTMGTAQFEAFELLLKGRYHWNQQTADGFQKAVAYFQEALRLDPKYGAAYAGLADYYALLGLWSLGDPNDVWPRAKVAALKALQLDDTLAEAHISMGYIRIFYDWDREQARREFLRALELNPGLPAAHMSYTVYLLQTEQLQEALKEMQKAKDLDPLSALMGSGVAFIYFYMRDFEQAIAEHKKVLELDANYTYSHLGLGLAYEQKGMYSEALAMLEKARASSGDNPMVLGSLGGCYARAGQAERAGELLAQLDQMGTRQYVSPVCQASIYIGLSQIEAAMEWLEKAADGRAAFLGYLPVWPPYDPLRAHPRFAALLKRIATPIADTPTQFD